MLNTTLRNLPRSKTTYKHPDYLLDDYKFKQHVDNTIREFLIIHSSLAEEYYLALNLSNDPTRPNEVSLEGTSPLIRQHIDISTKVIQRKFDNLLRKINGQEAMPEITTIDKLMDDVVDSIENPTTIFLALMKHIESAICKYRK
jgi:hypothetical protein